jgi:hypothetical protein
MDLTWERETSNIFDSRVESIAPATTLMANHPNLPISPGVGARRKGPKSLPTLPLSAFSAPNTGPRMEGTDERRPRRSRRRRRHESQQYRTGRVRSRLRHYHLSLFFCLFFILFYFLISIVFRID